MVCSNHNTALTLEANKNRNVILRQSLSFSETIFISKHDWAYIRAMKTYCLGSEDYIFNVQIPSPFANSDHFQL